MAALLIVGGVIIREKIEKSKAKKRAKDDERYRELVQETERRLSLNTASPMGDVDGRVSGDEDDEQPPSYEHVVRSNSGGFQDPEPAPEQPQRRDSALKRRSRKGLKVFLKGAS